jgi:hypothetical protein
MTRDASVPAPIGNGVCKRRGLPNPPGRSTRAIRGACTAASSARYWMNQLKSGLSAWVPRLNRLTFYQMLPIPL